jgi:anti-anti-sigma factor
MASTITTRSAAHGVIILDYDGRIAFSEGGADFRNVIRGLIEKGYVNILIDFAKVTFIDSSGVGDLIALHNRAKNEGGALKLVNIGEKIAKDFAIMKLDNIFEIFRDEAEAIQSYAK